jgi:mono/diheme cytochrome c family protein
MLIEGANVIRGAVRVILVFGAFNVAGAEPVSDDHNPGQKTFLQYCAPCHGKDASGGSTPDIRGLSKEDLVMAVQGVDQMPSIDITDDDLDSISVYLLSLIPND